MPFLPGGTAIGMLRLALPVDWSAAKECKIEVFKPAPLPGSSEAGGVLIACFMGTFCLSGPVIISFCLSTRVYLMKDISIA